MPAAPAELPLLIDYLEHYAAVAPDREAMVLGALRWTYRQVADQVDRLTRAFLAGGIAKGDRVAIMGTPRPECFAGFLAASSIGAIVLGLNPKFPPSELSYFVGDAEPRLLLGFAADAEGDHRETLRALGDHSPAVERVVALGDGTRDTLPWARFLAEGDAVPADAVRRARAEVAPADPALIVYTSGTTGRPKGAVLPHHGLSFCSRVQAEHWGGDDIRLLVNLPVNHIGFMGDMCAYALVAGATAFFMEKFDPIGILELIQAERLTGWGQVPTMFQITVAMPQFPQYDLSSLERIIWGGACAPRELLETLAATGARLATSFGMTETTGSITYTDDDADMDQLVNTVGRPDPRFEVRIARDDGTPVRAGEEGEIQVRGGHIMIEYWRRPEATAAAIDADGWLHTGDVALLRPDGAYSIRGRLSGMYKSGGENVYPREVEMVLEQHPGVAMAAVVGVPDPLYQEVGHAFVMPNWGAAPTADELRAFCRERLANFKVPKEFFIRDLLPMLPIGKVDRVALRQEALAGGPRAT